MQFRFVWILLLFWGAKAEAYSFPYSNPYLATITAGLLKPDYLDKSIAYQEFSIRGNPARNSVPFFGSKRNQVTLRYWAGKPGKPLLILVAGIGGSAASTYQNFLSYHFAKRGFHVLTLPSPFHYTFALASSTYALPGHTATDAKDLYELMQKAVERIEKKKKIDFPAFHLLGVSMGALESAYLAEIDSREKKFTFEKVLLINPPVNPTFGGETLDQLLQSGASISPDDKKSLQERLIKIGIDSLVLGDINSPDYFLNLETRFPTTETEKKYIIGKSMIEFLEALVFTTQQVNDLGVLKNPIAIDDPDPRLEESSNFRYEDYLRKILLPGLQQTWRKDLTLEELVKTSTLNSLGVFLQNQTNIFVMHNEDDFIINAEDISFLKTTFGSRLSLYPYGGHVGNLWYKENLEKILSTFDSAQ
jgi:pimeloyl-ACP methyl ester carboxylesterase